MAKGHMADSKLMIVPGIVEVQAVVKGQKTLTSESVNGRW
jgi:hypothetical protein